MKIIGESLNVMEALHPNLKITYLPRVGKFGPEMVESLSKELRVPKNNMFIGAPEAKHKFSLEDFGGVRVIF